MKKMKKINKILKSMLEVEPKDELLCGDIWLTIDYKDFVKGVFVQVESKEYDDGSYSEDIFSVYAYENFVSDCDKNIIESNYDKTIFEFEFNRSDIDKLIKRDTIKNY